MKFGFEFLSSFSAVFAQILLMLNHFLNEFETPSILAKLVSLNLIVLNSYA